MDTKSLENKIRDAGLKVTPQRIALLNILYNSNHPTAEFLIARVKEKYSSTSSGTIYHILDTFLEHGIISRVYTHKGVMRYDAILSDHHHLHEEGTDRIEDYFDDELYEVIKTHFQKKPVKGFDLTNIKVKLVGHFND